MRAFVLAILVLLMPLCVLAAEVQVRIAEKDCRWLSTHIPTDDVAYRPGVDVKGKPVRSADLESTDRLVLPEQIELEILIPTRVFRPIRLEGKAGTISVDIKTGKVSYNDQVLNDPEKDRLAGFCRKQKK